MLDVLTHILDRRRADPNSDGDHGMVVNIVSWVLLVVTVFTLLARMAMKMVYAKRGHRFGWDDVFILLAFLFSIGQTIAVSIEASQALGQHYLALSSDSKSIFQKAEYAACMLYIANLGCARISLCILIKVILPGRTSRSTTLVFIGLTAIWTVSGVLATAFPCSFPNPWQFGPEKKCFQFVKFVNYVGVTNIVVEVLLVTIPLFVWNLRLDAGRRVSVSCAFIARLSIPAAVSAQLYFFNRYPKSPDFTYHYWRAALCIQIAQNLSIITACLPYLHPFIISIHAGRIQPDSLVFECQSCKSLKERIHKQFGWSTKFDATSSQDSTMPMRDRKGDDEESCCRPLATWGLDRSSAHPHTQHFNHFPSYIAEPVTGPSPQVPENIFNRSVHIDSLHPIQNTLYNNTMSKELPVIPKTLAQVGVLPLGDWETDSGSGNSNADRDSAGSSASRRPASDYIFQREKVISVPENHELYREDYWKKYPPPPKSPGLPRKMSLKYIPDLPRKMSVRKAKPPGKG